VSARTRAPPQQLQSPPQDWRSLQGVTFNPPIYSLFGTQRNGGAHQNEIKWGKAFFFLYTTFSKAQKRKHRFFLFFLRLDWHSCSARYRVTGCTQKSLDWFGVCVQRNHLPLACVATQGVGRSAGVCCNSYWPYQGVFLARATIMAEGSPKSVKKRMGASGAFRAGDLINGLQVRPASHALRLTSPSLSQSPVHTYPRSNINFPKRREGLRDNPKTGCGRAQKICTCDCLLLLAFDPPLQCKVTRHAVLAASRGGDNPAPATPRPLTHPPTPQPILPAHSQKNKNNFRTTSPRLKQSRRIAGGSCRRRRSRSYSWRASTSGWRTAAAMERPPQWTSTRCRAPR
jgi:hypothetical protein